MAGPGQGRAHPVAAVLALAAAAVMKRIAGLGTQNLSVAGVAGCWRVWLVPSGLGNGFLGSGAVDEILASAAAAISGAGRAVQRTGQPGEATR